jgi:hypothetical protein
VKLTSTVDVHRRLLEAALGELDDVGPNRLRSDLSTRPGDVTRNTASAFWIAPTDRSR